MKNLVLIICATLILLANSAGVQGQNVIDGPYKKMNTQNRKAAPLPSVREADVIYQKTIWRIIDLREKMNQALYYPTREMQGRKNLVSVLVDGIKEGEIQAFDASTDNEFKVPITYKQVEEVFDAGQKLTEKRNLTTGEMVKDTISVSIPIIDVKEFMVKEVWYFDKHTSTLEVRIIGLCPIQEYYGEDDVNQENLLKRKVFWVYFPAARNLLAKWEVLNPFNDAKSISFDDLFITRKFDSYITKESNIYNNRSITTYAEGDYHVEESERIKNDIFDYEQNLWEY